MATAVAHKRPNLLRFYEAAATCDSYASIAERVLKPLAEQIGASSGVFFKFEDMTTNPRIGRHHAFSVDETAIESYRSKFVSIDPLAKCLVTAPSPDVRPRIERLLDVLSRRDLEQTTYYDQFCRPSGAHDILGIMVYPPAREPIGYSFCLHRNVSLPPFGEREISYAQQMLPALLSVSRTLALHDDVSRTNGLRMAMTTALDDASVAVINDNLDIEFITRQMSHELALPRAGNLEAIVKQERTQLEPLLATIRQLLDNPCGNATQTVGLINANGQDPVPLKLALRLVEPTVGDRRVIVNSLRSVLHGALVRRAKESSMTDREIEIVTLLVAGLPNRQIAARLGITARTVENHLRSIYLKANAHSRLQVLHNMLGQA